MDEDRVIGTARKNAHLVFQVALSQHEGRSYVSVQTCDLPEGTGGKPQPTVRGFYVKPTAARELGKLLIEAADQACLEDRSNGPAVGGECAMPRGDQPRAAKSRVRIRSGWETSR